MIALRVEDLHVRHPERGGLLRRVVRHLHAVDGLGFRIEAGRSFALVGESGCGKTSAARAILRLGPGEGRAWLATPEGEVDLLALDEPALRRVRRHIQVVFQDPVASLNPRHTVLQIVGRPLLLHGECSEADLEARVCAELAAVGLDAGALHRHPHAFSGGQRQRIAIARALALRPRVLVCDEAVSALDVSVRAQILRLLQARQAEDGFAMLFIGHDLGVVRHVADRVGVMYRGRLVETADCARLFDDPRHPYTQALLSASPELDPERRRPRVKLRPDAGTPGRGCVFQRRCPVAEARCEAEDPPENDGVRCWLGRG